MSTAALVNARAGSNGGRGGGGSTTVQTAQLHQQQQQSFGTANRGSIGLSANVKKNEETMVTENGKTETPSRPPSSQVKEEGEKKVSPEDKQQALTAAPSGKSVDDDKMYSDDLRSILVEVAKSGTSSTLSWTEHEISFSAAADNRTNEARRPLHSPAGGPPRKRQRNGLHHSSTSRTGMKRPLSFRAGGSLSHHQSPGHSSRTSVSEMEDMSQYDSEGTVGSELSMDRARAQHLLNGVLNGFNQKQKANAVNKPVESPKQPQGKYTSLRQVFRIATGSVLDHFFHKRGGYKLSPAEKRTNQMEGDKTDSRLTAGPRTGEEVFRQRKQRLLDLLADLEEAAGGDANAAPLYVSGPPFTVQRVAEVLLTPERYYTRTHKLCNCLEKLLLVTSSIRSFGGSTGGITSQSRQEEQEIEALAHERDRQLSEYRRKRYPRLLARANEGEIYDADMEMAPSSPPKASSPEGRMCASETERTEDAGGTDDDDSSNNNRTNKDDKEDLLEAARASLRSKFDHVGIDPHSAVANATREHQNGNRSMTNSPPPPNFPGTAAGIGLSGHAHGGLLRHHDQEHQGGSNSSLVVRTPSPIMFKTTAEGASSPNKASPTPVHPTHQNLQLLQMHHAAVLAGVSPFDMMRLNGGGQAAASQHGSGVGTLSVQSGSGMMPNLKEMDVDCRSSASSDIDSESDDVSLDDSASDRSDGSDSNEPTTSSAAARASALNRAQQQQQVQPNRRMLGSTSTSAFSSSIGQRAPRHDPTVPNAAGGSGRQNEAEYQSGDSVDSLKAEDSDSSSDMAD